MSSKSRTVAIVDTNVFMGADKAPFKELRNTDIVIPMMVILELEKHRGDEGGPGWAARVVLHYIEKLRTDFGGHSLIEGAESYNGNTVTIDPDHKDVDKVMDLLHTQDKDGDLEILSVAFNIQEEERRKGKSARDVILYTNDLPMRIKADAFLSLKVSPWGSDVSRQFTGTADIDLTAEDVTEKEVTADMIRSRLDDTDSKAGHLLVRARLEKDIAPVPFILEGDEVTCMCDHTEKIGRIVAKGAEQSAAIRYLKDDSITAVSLGGTAGAGKSFLALAAAMEAVNPQSRKEPKGGYERILVFRPMYEVGQQKVGFLPGDLEEKMRPWAQAIWDNVRKIDHLRNGGSGAAERKKRRAEERQDGAVKRMTIEEMHPEIEVSPITWIRGRTIENSFIIVDDAQSLERPLLLDILTRLGESSRIVFTFDMDQQDNPNPHMSPGTSISSVIDDLMDDPSFAHIDFTVSRRGRMAQKAAVLLSRK